MIPDQQHLTTGPLTGAAAVAVTPHHLASAAALSVIGEGGSAVDGAIAADAVLGVVLPDTCGIGGDLFALIHTPGDEAPAALNASGRAGSGASSGDLRAAGFTEMPLRHPATVTVPGCVDGWEALQARFGRLPLSRVVAPAVALAEDGFPVSEELAASLIRIQDLLAGQASAPPLYPGGVPPQPGMVLRRQRLGALLRAIGETGRAPFYGGAVGRAIVAATDHILTQGDLDEVQADWVDPIGIDVFGLRGWTIPPNSQGYLTLAAAKILEAIDPPTDPEDPGYIHAVIEAYRAVAWQRDDVVSDPRTTNHEAAWYLDETRLRDLAGDIDREKSRTWPTPVTGAGGTAYLCVRDTEGMAVSFIQSNFHGIGSGISAGETGVFLHNRGAGFNLAPGHPNEWMPGRRPLHTLAPTLWTHDGRFRMALGTRGGAHQPQLLLQVAAALFIARCDGTAAQAMPRWILDGFGPGESPVVRLEETMPEGVVSGLRARGHDISIARGVQPGWGPVSIIMSGITSGITPGITPGDTPESASASSRNPDVAGFADPRVSTAAALASGGAAASV